MTRAEHGLRAILGRGATLPPDWSALSERYERISDDPVLYICRQEDSISYGKTFDEKGRPYSPHTEWTRKEGEAINGTMSIMRHNAALERKNSPSLDTKDKSSPELTTEDWRRLRSFMYHAVGVLNEAQRSCFNAIRQRFMAYEHLSNMTCTDMLVYDWNTYGACAFLLNGLPSRFYMRYVIDQGMLYPYVARLREYLMEHHPGQSWVNKVCTGVYLISYHAIASIIVVNGGLQDLRLLQPSTIRRPFPLIRYLHGLSTSECVRTFILTIAPIYAVRWLFVVKTTAPTTTSVREIIDVYERQRSPLLDSNTTMTPMMISQRMTCWTSDVFASIRAVWASMYLAPHELKRRWWQDFLLQFRETSWNRDSQWHRQTDFERIRNGHSRPLHQWPEVLQKRSCRKLLQKMLLLPFYFVSARLITRIALRDPMLSALPQASALRAEAYPLLPGMSSLTSFVGLRSTGRFVGKIFLIFCLQAAVSGVLVGVESAVALFVLRTATPSKGRPFRQGSVVREEESQESDRCPRDERRRELASAIRVGMEWS